MMPRSKTRGPTIADLATALETGATTSRALVEDCLSRIDDPSGEGARAFIYVDRAKAVAAADTYDLLRKAGRAPTAYAGIPISIKDLFDLEGEPTLAGSKVLRGAPPAVRDAEAIGRLKRAGLIPIGRTNMTEFAFSGLGLNPHYGTPLSIWDRETGRIPGGSSSGAAVSVADGMAHAGIGTDTGGSCRIPAAFNALVGYKPTAHRISRQGVLPLSTTLDSVGVLARSVACCETIDAILAGSSPPAVARFEGSDLRILVPLNVVLADMEPEVELAFGQALECLRKLGATICEEKLNELDAILALTAKGGFSAPECLAWHQRLIARAAYAYDPRVLTRIVSGGQQSAVDYIQLTNGRRNIVERVRHRLSGFDVVAFPTTPIVPPKLSQISSDEIYASLNRLCLRNPSFVNMWDGCAISLPIGKRGNAPIGLTLAAAGDKDAHLFSCARTVEAMLNAEGGR